jgi:small subunit ribosomal protein S20
MCDAQYDGPPSLTNQILIRIVSRLYRTRRNPVLANIQSAKKRARQSLKRRLHNASIRSLMRTQVKKVVTALDNKDRAAASSTYQQAVPIIDRMVRKRLIHKNKAARHKSRLNAQIKALG